MIHNFVRINAISSALWDSYSVLAENDTLIEQPFQWLLLRVNSSCVEKEPTSKSCIQNVDNGILCSACGKFQCLPIIYRFGSTLLIAQSGNMSIREYEQDPAHCVVIVVSRQLRIQDEFLFFHQNLPIRPFPRFSRWHRHTKRQITIYLLVWITENWLTWQKFPEITFVVCHRYCVIFF
jgi:hypothetical protein